MPYLTDPIEKYKGCPRCIPGPDYLDRGPYSCDACYKSECEDIMDHVGKPGPTPELMPLYWDAADELCLCRACIDAGPDDEGL